MSSRIPDSSHLKQLSAVVLALPYPSLLIGTIHTTTRRSKRQRPCRVGECKQLSWDMQFQSIPITHTGSPMPKHLDRLAKRLASDFSVTLTVASQKVFPSKIDVVTWYCRVHNDKHER
jgi:hypothetical protein